MDISRDGSRVPPASRWRPLPFLLLSCVTIVLIPSFTPQALAHPALADYIRHDVSLVVGAREIEVGVELTFQQFYALGERRRMDTDRDGTITRDDLNVYLAKIDDSIQEGIRLTIANHPVELIPLYDPQIDLQRVARVDLTSCVLKFSFFAHTPAELKPGADLVVEDRLWSSLPVICSLDAAGRNGVRLLPGEEDDATAQAGGVAPIHRLLAHCVAAPNPARETRTPTHPAKKELSVAALPSVVGAASSMPPAPLSQRRWPVLIALFCTLLIAAGRAMRRYGRRGGLL